MTDIIERLRQTSRDFGMVAAVTALEAADEIERLRSALTEVLAFQSAKDVPSIHDWGRWRRVRDGIVAPVAEPKRKVIHVTESMGAALEGAGLTSCVGCGAPAGEGHMPNCPASNKITGVGSAALWGEMTCERAVFDKPVTVQRDEALELDMQAGTVRVVKGDDAEGSLLPLMLSDLVREAQKVLESDGDMPVVVETCVAGSEYNETHTLPASDRLQVEEAPRVLTEYWPGKFQRAFVIDG